MTVLRSISVVLLLGVALASPSAAPVRAQSADGNAAAGREAFLRADYEAAKRILEPLAEAGEAEAQYWIGVMYAHGRGYPEVCRQAIRWYEMAARQRHAAAAFNAGFMWYHGWGTAGDECSLPADPERAAPWLRQAAEAGYPRAQFLVARMYATGEGLGRSADAAFDWMRRAAESGLAEAGYELALMRAEAGDRIDAWAWFSVLADRGYPGAAMNRRRLEANMSEEAIGAARERADRLRSPD